jgi:hypothetical protein
MYIGYERHRHLGSTSRGERRPLRTRSCLRETGRCPRCHCGPSAALGRAAPRLRTTSLGVTCLRQRARGVPRHGCPGHASDVALPRCTGTANNAEIAKTARVRTSGARTCTQSVRRECWPGDASASRRAAETLISSGRIRVVGRVVTELGTKVDPRRSRSGGLRSGESRSNGSRRGESRSGDRRPRSKRLPGELPGGGRGRRNRRGETDGPPRRRRRRPWPSWLLVHALPLRLRKSRSTGTRSKRMGA